VHTDKTEYIVSTITQRFSTDRERREEALRDVLAISNPGKDSDSIEKIAGAVPELPSAIYRKWATMFARRLYETVPPEQVDDLCLGTPESVATLTLVFVMFMESERMEKQVALDLQEYSGRNSAETVH
jgi:hypothetical protein